MGSQIQLWLEADSSAARPAFERVVDWFEETEAMLSRFRPDSELCGLNRTPDRWVPVSPLLWRVLKSALSLARATGGLFDPTVLPALEAAGYSETFEKMGANVHVADPVSGSERPVPAGWQQVALDPARRAVRLPAGVRLDLGGVAKGIVAQDAAHILSDVGPALVDAGGDLTAGHAPHGWHGWPVAVAAPARAGEAERDLFEVWLAQATLATSGIDYRRWRRGSETAHHLIDPRTGRPSTSDVITATVLARDATHAEGWATAALVAGSETAMRSLGDRRMAAALVCSDGRLLLTPTMEEERI
jgi:thiamine biosynthesis lipoprotein